MANKRENTLSSKKLGRILVWKITCYEHGTLFDSFWHNSSVAARVYVRDISYGFKILTVGFSWVICLRKKYQFLFELLH